MNRRNRFWRWFRLAVLAAGLAGAARAQTTITQSFTTTGAQPGWSFTNSSAYNSFTPTSGQRIGRTTLRGLELSNGTTNTATAAQYTGSFSAAGASVYAQFSYQMYGGSGGTTLGGDGLTFFFYDASVASFSAGAYGGSLGYAQKTGINGLSGGYIGVGLDAYGNYSVASEGRVGGQAGVTDPNQTTESIAVRGPEAGGYAYLGGTTAHLGTGNANTNIDATSASTTTNTVQVLLSATNQLTVTLAQGGSTPQTVLQMDLSGYARPDLLSFGFTAGSGNATDYMFVNNLTVTTLAASKWTNAGGTGNWGLNTNWNPSVVPTSGSDILFDNSTVGTAQTIGTGANRTVRSITFDAPFDYTVNNNTLTFDRGSVPGFSGIAVTQTHGTGVDTINSALALNNDITVHNNASGTLNLNGTIATGGHTLTFDGSGNGTNVNGAISGTGAVVKNDTGTVTLAGNNTFSGGTTIADGTLNANSSTALGTGNVTLAGGTLASTNNSTVNRPILLTANSAMANITNTGTLTQAGANRTLNLNGVTQAGAVALSDTTTGHTLTVQVDAGTSTISGAIANGAAGATASNLTKTGGGELVLSGTNTYTGTTTISTGTLSLGKSDTLAQSSKVSIDASGTLNLNSFSQKIGTLTALAGGATVDFGPTGTANNFVFGNYVAPSSGVLVVNNWESGSDKLASTVSGQTVSSVYFSGYGIATLAGTASAVGSYGNAYLITPGAQNLTVWSGSGSNLWSTGANWTNGRPTSTQIAVFDATGAGRTAVSLDASYTLAGLQFAANAPSYTITPSTAANTLTLSGSIPYIQQKSAVLQTIAANLSIGGNTVIDMTGTGDLALSGNITGTRNLVKDGLGSGKLILSGNNTGFTGDLYLNNGILQAAATNALGSSGSTAVTIAQNATLELANSGTAANAITVNGSGVAGAGAIHNVAGANTLSGTVTQAGATTIAADAGTGLTLTGNLTGTADTTFAGSGNITVARISTTAGNVTVNGSGTGTVTFNGGTANSYTGDTILNSGVLALAKSGGATAVAGNLIVNGGTVRLDASNQVASTSAVTLAGSGVLNVNGQANTIAQLNSTSSTATVAVGSGALTITAVNNQNSSFAGSLTSAADGSLTLAGTGKVYLTGANAGFLGAININGGTLNASGSNSVLGLGTVNVASGANLQIQGGIALNNAFTVAGTGTTANGAIQNLAGTNLLNGTITLAGDTRFESDSGSLSIGGNVQLGTRALTVAGASDTAISGVISGTGNLVKSDAGTLSLSGANSYSGGTAINAGVVNLSSNAGLGTGGATVASGATLQVQGGITASNALTLNGTGTSSNGALQSGGGSNTLTGAVTLGSASRIQSDSNTLTLNTIALGANTVTLAGGGAINVNGAVSGTGAVVKIDAGTTTLNAANSYSGTTTVNAGTLALGATGAISSTAGVTVNGGTLAINASGALNGSGNLTVASGANVSLATGVTQSIAGLTTGATSTLSLAANSTLTVNRSAATTLSGTLTGTGTLAFTGGGSLTLGNNISFGGTLSFGGTTIGGTPSSTVYLAGNVTLDTLHITGDTVLDFGNSSATTLSVNTLVIDANVHVTVVNWVNLTDYFYANYFPGAVLDQRGTTPIPSNTSTQVTFTPYSNSQTAWQSYDHQITPAPEPATYGAWFVGAALAAFGWHSFSRRRRSPDAPDAQPTTC